MYIQFDLIRLLTHSVQFRFEFSKNHNQIISIETRFFPKPNYYPVKQFLTALTDSISVRFPMISVAITIHNPSPLDCSSGQEGVIGGLNFQIRIHFLHSHYGST